MNQFYGQARDESGEGITLAGHLIWKKCMFLSQIYCKNKDCAHILGLLWLWMEDDNKGDGSPMIRMS